MSEKREESFILWFKELGIEDVPLVGGKNASLGEMYQNLSDKGVAVPNGFAITAHAYEYFLEQTGTKQKIEDILQTLDTKDLRNLQEHGHKVREEILRAEFPEDLQKVIEATYEELTKVEGGNIDMDVAVRSSATAEDLPDASFAGQQETFLNIKGAYEVLDATKRCMASLFTNRAISYRSDKGYDHFNVSLSVTVQKMVRSDEAGSGVMFSIDTESGFENAVLINAAYGLGEMVVQGKVEPDEYYVFKPTLMDGVSTTKSGELSFKYRPIVGKSLGHKEDKMIYSLEGNDPVREVPVPEEDRKKFVLTDDEVLKLGYWACLIEEHYNKPMDIEWAKDGMTGELYIVQARPETVHSQSDANVLEEYVIESNGKNVLVDGVSVGSKIGQGKVRVLKDVSEIHDFEPGEVLVTEITDPDWEPIMKVAAAIVTNSGGRTSHAAIVSRELGIPAVVGCKTAATSVSTGQEVTVSCAEGETGFIYEGKVPFEINKHDIGEIKDPKTDIMQIVADPSRAFDFSMIPNHGVGLARLEMIILNAIKVHPLALLRFDELEDEKVKKEIEEITHGYDNKVDYFIDKLAIGVSRIVAAFHPHQVIVRLSDFKSNEYANLIGGKQFEPHEENPMIGWRGASRYYSAEYKDAFVLECKAMKKVREEMGLTNMKLMIPFVRTPEEGQKVVDILADNGLKSGDNDLEIYMMCEVPSNVILADEFIKIFDGFSIGSNDLTQLLLGLDRDSGLVAHIYDERNPAIKIMLERAIQKVHAAGKKIGICGQAPSDYPEIAEFLVDEGIDTMSVTPDTCLKTLVNVSKYEQTKK